MAEDRFLWSFGKLFECDDDKASQWRTRVRDLAIGSLQLTQMNAFVCCKVLEATRMRRDTRCLVNRGLIITQILRYGGTILKLKKVEA